VNQRCFAQHEKAVPIPLIVILSAAKDLMAIPIPSLVILSAAKDLVLIDHDNPLNVFANVEDPHFVPIDSSSCFVDDISRAGH